MKTLFIHDHIFYKGTNDEFYTSGVFDSDLWLRYLKHFDSLTVVGRGKVLPSDANNNYSLSSRENVFFNVFEDISGGFDYYKFYKSIVVRLTNLIKSHDFVIIRLPSTLGNFAANICFKEDKKYVVEVVGCAFESFWNYGGVAAKIIAPYAYFSMKKGVKNSNGAIYVTKDLLQKRYPMKGLNTNISNVYIDNLTESVLDDHIALLSGNKEEYKIGVVGNISMKYKGYEILFRAVELLKNKIRVKIYLVGGGDQSYILNLIDTYGLNDSVVLLGRKNRGEVIDFLDSLDLYIQPSLTEGLPRATIEAMSRACPVLASSAGGLPELLEQKYLHKPGDYKKLSSQLFRVLIEKGSLAIMSKQNFETAKLYTINLLSDKREVFFNTIKDSI